MVYSVDRLHFYVAGSFSCCHKSFQIMFFKLQLHKREETGHKKTVCQTYTFKPVFSDLPKWKIDLT